MNVTAPENRQEQQQDTGINELKTVEAILNNPQNAEKLKNQFGSKLEKEFTKGIEGINKINKLRDHLNPLLEDIKNTQTKINLDDQEGLKALDKFLNDCLQKNDMVQTYNKNIIQMLKKLDNGMGRDVNIDEKQIMLKSVESVLTTDIDKRRTILKLEYKVDEKSTIKFKISEGGIKIVDGAITIPDKDGKDQYFNIVQDDKGGLKLETNPDGLRAKLASYTVTGNAIRTGGERVINEGGKYKVNMQNNIDGSLISFVLDENGLINGTNQREIQGNYKVSIDQNNNTFNITDLKATEKKEAKKIKENQEIAELDFNKIVDNKINTLKTEQANESSKNTQVGFKKAGEIQTQIKSLEEMKTNYNQISKKTAEIDTQIGTINTEIAKTKNDENFEKAATLAGQKTALESQKAEIQKLELEMKKNAKDDNRDKVDATWKQIDKLIKPQATTEAAEPTTEAVKPGELTTESVISKLDDNLKSWHTKENSNNKLGDIITLLKENDGDSAKIKTKKTELSALLAAGNMKGFQRAVGIQEREIWKDGSSKVDGKLGKYTSSKVKEYLTNTAAETVADVSTDAAITETTTNTVAETAAVTSETTTNTGAKTVATVYIDAEGNEITEISKINVEENLKFGDKFNETGLDKNVLESYYEGYQQEFNMIVDSYDGLKKDLLKDKNTDELDEFVMSLLKDMQNKILNLKNIAGNGFKPGETLSFSGGVYTIQEDLFKSMTSNKILKEAINKNVITEDEANQYKFNILRAAIDDI